MPPEFSKLSVSLDEEANKNIVLIVVFFNPERILENGIVYNGINYPIDGIVAWSSTWSSGVGNKVSRSIFFVVERIERRVNVSR